MPSRNDWRSRNQNVHSSEAQRRGGRRDPIHGRPRGSPRGEPGWQARLWPGADDEDQDDSYDELPPRSEENRWSVDDDQDEGYLGGSGHARPLYRPDANAVGSQGYYEGFGRRGQQEWRPGPPEPFRSSWSGRQPYAKGPKGYVRSDQRIREDLCDRLMVMPEIDSSDVEVSVSQGVVTLAGTIPDRAMKHHLERLADAIAGVIDVNNQLRLRQRAPPPPAQAQAAVSPAASPPQTDRQQPAPPAGGKETVGR